MAEGSETRPRVKEAPASLAGEVLGNYRIVSELGSGGMGVVYLAEHTLLGRKVAVKILRNDVAPELVERFFTEAKAAATLQHPGLVDVFDFGHDKRGSAYIVMEFLAGESLAERLERDPRLPIPIALAITRAVANALHCAHELGIVHRDLKPGNIFLVPDADAPAGVRTKVLDFGIAKLLRDREPRSVKTHSGALIGTPRYMSPEQCKSAKSVDGRADIYSLGCILYEMILGVAPFDYDTWAELVAAHLHENPPPPTELDPTLPAQVDKLVTSMLEKNPESRPPSMQELAAQIDLVIKELGGATIRVTPHAGIKRPSTRPIKDPGSTDPTLPAAIGDSQERGAFPEGNKSPSGQKLAEARQPLITAVPPAKRNPPWVAIAIGFVGVTGIVIAVIALRKGDKPTEPQNDVRIVVDDRQDIGSDSPETLVVVVDKPVDKPAVDKPAVDKPVEKTVPKPPPDQTQVLAQAFSRHKKQLGDCFQAHPGQGRGEALSMRFQIDSSGKILVAEILPASIAQTELGKCLTNVAKKTVFGKQNAATFRIPINVD